MTIPKLFAALLIVFFSTAAVTAQSKPPVETRNAALRYWLAFADLQDPPADKTTTDLLEKVAAGEAPWDQQKLGPILEKNLDAIRRMQRATTLPDCDWGIEYGLGPRASIGYVPRARVLARLNTLYGMQQLAAGNTQTALDSWLAGVHFSQHLAKGGSLIFNLVAKTALLSNFHALQQALNSNRLNSAQREQIRATLREIPETGFDWSLALQMEESSMNIMLVELGKSTNPAEYFQQLTGEATLQDFSLPNSTQIAEYHRLMAAASESLRITPQAAREKLATLQAQIKTLHPFFQSVIPSFQRINSARIEVFNSRQQVVTALNAT
jgi:hypothetical protein